MHAANSTPSVAPPLLWLAAQPTPRWRRPVFARRPAHGRPSSLAAFLVKPVGRPPHDAFRGGASVHVVASVNRSDLLSAVTRSSAGKPLPRNLFGGLCSAWLQMGAELWCRGTLSAASSATAAPDGLRLMPRHSKICGTAIAFCVPYGWLRNAVDIHE